MRFFTLLWLALHLTFESRLSLLCMHIVGHATESEIHASGNLWPPPPPPLSLSPCDQIREKESLPLNTKIRTSNGKFAKCCHQVTVSRAPTASMQWLIQTKNEQHFPARSSCFVNFERPQTRSRLGQLHAEWCNFLHSVGNLTILDLTGTQNKIVTACGSVWLLWAHVNCTLTMSLDNVHLLFQDSNFASKTTNIWNILAQTDVTFCGGRSRSAVDLRFCWSAPRTGAVSGWSLLLFCQKATE